MSIQDARGGLHGVSDGRYQEKLGTRPGGGLAGPDGLSGTAVVQRFASAQWGGFDEVRSTEDERVYLRAGELHRTNGFAVEWPDGSGEYYLGGEQVQPPDDGEIGLHLARVTDGTQFWSSGNGSYSVEVDADGARRFLLDGDFHREDAPAVIGADGCEHWYRFGTEHEPPEPPVAEPGDAPLVSRQNDPGAGAGYL